MQPTRDRVHCGQLLSGYELRLAGFISKLATLSNFAASKTGISDRLLIAKQLFPMNDPTKPKATPPKRTCPHCGRRTELTTHLPKTGNYPAHDVFRCKTCGIMEWVKSISRKIKPGRTGCATGLLNTWPHIGLRALEGYAR